MPCEIDWESEGVVVRFRGTFDRNANVDAAIEIYKDPRVQDIKYVIWDTSMISEVQFKNGETLTLSMADQIVSARIPKIKMAFYAPCENARRICNEYISHYQSRQTGWEFIVSDDMECIKAWIAS